MKRVNITLEEAQWELLRTLAFDDRSNVSELIRKAVRAKYGDNPKEKKWLEKELKSTVKKIIEEKKQDYNFNPVPKLGKKK